MSQQIRFDILFNADTSQAKNQINELRTMLGSVAKNQSALVIDDSSIKKASQAALELEGHLKNATNVNTGKLDLSRFSKSMQQSGHNLEYFRNTLTAIGPQGQQAFMTLTQSIATADTASMRLGAKMSGLLTTLKNTAKWQISSSLIKGFTNAIRESYQYAQDLNKSLNDIRIVTGQSIEQMDKFAKSANEAARALSTSTLDYTKSALIFYQQGLSDEEVKKRTDVVTKMANVTGDAAKDVSSYMTAVWNNFDDGTKSLEYYADAMTALGAATASSTSEIAGGLEKFASIGQTVGLSYEYATAALATIVAETRQSEEVVGTALKTLFSRMQGLKLGKTLEDGTDLNKYSEGLAAVGVNIKDTNGELKDMDVIIDEVGQKWQTLARDQQMALAQTVAGIRQYNQFMSLMNNYETFKVNVDIASGSEGTLQEQLEIFQEGWKAAAKEVQAAAENIYTKLMDDDFFITILKVFEEFLDFIGRIIDGLGGLKGILLLIGTIALRSFSKELPRMLSNMALNIGVVTKKSQERALALQQENQANLEAMKAQTGYSAQLNAQVETYSIINKMTQQLTINQKNMSQAMIEGYQANIQLVQSIGAQITKDGERIDKLNQILALRQQEIVMNLRARGASENEIKIVIKLIQALKEKTQAYQAASKAGMNIKDQTKNWQINLKNIKNNNQAIKQVKNQMLQYSQSFSGLKNAQKAIQQLEQELKLAGNDVGLVEKAWVKFENEITSINDVGLQELISKIEIIKQRLNFHNIDGLDSLEKDMIELGQLIDDNRIKLAGMQGVMGQTPMHIMKMSEAVGILGSTLMNFGMVLTSITTLVDTWKQVIDGDASFGEAFIQTIVTLGMIVPMLTAAFNADTRAKTLNAVATLLGAKVTTLDNGQKVISAKNTKAQTVAQWGLNAALGPYILLITAIIALIGLLIFAVIKLVQWMKALEEPTPEEKLAQAAEAAKQLNDSLVKLRQTNQEIFESFEKYNSLKSALDKCTKGTEQWNKALQEVNNYALELMQKYPKLSKFDNLFTRNAEGLIELNEELFSQIEESLLREETLLTQASAISNAQVNLQTAELKHYNLQEATEDTIDLHESFGNDPNFLEAFNYFGGIDAYSGLTPEEVKEQYARTYAMAQNINAAKNAGNFGQTKAEAYKKINFEEWAQEERTTEAGTGQPFLQLLQQVKDYGAEESRQIIESTLKTFEEKNPYTQEALKFEDFYFPSEGQTDGSDTITAGTHNFKTQAEFKTKSGDIDMEAYYKQFGGYELEDYYNTKTSEFTNLMGETSEEFTNNFDLIASNLSKSVTHITYEIDEASKRVKQTFRFVVSSNYLDKNVSEQFLTVAAGKYENTYFKNHAQYLEAGNAGITLNRGTGRWVENEAAQAQFIADFEEKTGLSYQRPTDYARRNSETGTIEYGYFDENGEIAYHSADYMAQLMAASDAEEASSDEKWINDFANKAYTTLENNSSAKAMTNWVANKTFGDITPEEYDQLLKDMGLSSETGGNFNNVAEAEAWLDKVYGSDNDGNIVKETGILLGGTDDEDASALLMQTLQNQNAQFLEISNKLSNTDLKSDFDNIVKDQSKISTNSQLGLIETLEKQNGYEALQTFVQEGGKDLNNLTTEEIEGYGKALGEIDWNTASIETVTATFEKCGIAIDNTNESIKKLLVNISDPNILIGLDNIINNYQKQNKIIGDLKNNDKISSEDYSSLDSETQKYFNKTLDGMYQLSAEASVLQKNLKENTFDNLMVDITKLNNQLIEPQKTLEERYINDDLMRSVQDKDNRTEGQMQEFLNRVSGTETTLTGESLQNAVDQYFQKDENGENLSDEANDKWDNYVNLITENENKIADITDKIFSYESIMAQDAQSTDDLNKMVEDGYIQENSDAYNKRYLEIEKLDQVDELDTEEIDDYAEHLQNVAKESELVNDDLENNEEAARKVAVATLRMNKGIDKLADGIDDWSSVLRSSEEDSDEYREAMEGVTDALSDVLGVNQDFISKDFVSNHLSLIEEAATGSESAILALQKALSQDILIQVGGVENFNELDSDIQSIHNKLWDLSQEDIQIGAHLSTGEFSENAQKIVDEAGMSVSQAQAYFNSLGYEPEFVMTEESHNVPVTGVETIGDPPEIGTVEYKVGEETLSYPYIKSQKTRQQPVDLGVREEKYLVPAMSADGKTPQIKSLTRTNSGGKMNNYSSRNKGGKSPGSGSGGGGGKGKSSKPQKTEHKKKDDEIERYYQINKRLEDVQQNLDEIAKKKDRAFGKEKLKAMQEEIAAYDVLIATQRQYQAEIEKNLAYDKSELTKLGLGITFDKDGNISNYEAVMNKLINEYNAAATRYDAAKNALGEDGDSTAIDETWEKAEKRYEEAIKLMERYAETEQLLDDKKAEINDLINEQIEKELEELDYTVQLHIDVRNDDLALLDHILEQIGDSAWDAAEAFAALNNQTANNIALSQDYTNGLNSIFERHGLGADAMSGLLNGSLSIADLENIGLEKNNGVGFTQTEIDMIKSYRDGLLESNSALLELRETIQNKIEESFDEFTEDIETQIETFDRLNQTIDNYKNLMDVIGLKPLAIDQETRKMLNDAKVTNANNNIAAVKAELDFVNDSLNATKEELNKAIARGASEDDIKYWEEQVDILEARSQEVGNTLVETMTTAAEAARDAFIDNVKMGLEEFEKAMSGSYGSIEKMREVYDRQRQKDEFFLQDYAKIYELSKLTRDINKSLDETDNVKAKKELRKITEEITKLEESGVKVTQYQIDNLRRQYELKLAAAQLEEARNTKSQVRMQQNEAGQWAYIYTADEQAVADAEQNYEDKLYAAQEANDTYIRELEDKMLSLQEEMMAKIEELDITTFDSMDEYNAKVQEIIDDYAQDLDWIGIELESALGNQATLYEQDWKIYNEITGYKISDSHYFIDDFNETLISIQSGFENLDAYQQQFSDSSQGLMATLGTSYQTWLGSIQSSFNNAGIAVEVADGKLKVFGNDTSSITTFNDVIDKLVNDKDKGIITLSQKAATETQSIAEKASKKFEEITKSVGDWQTDYSNYIDKMMAKNTQLATSINTMLANISGVKQAVHDKVDSILKNTYGKEEQKPKTTPSSSNTNNTGGSTQGDGKLSVGDSATFTGGTYYSDSYGLAPTGNRKGSGKVKITQVFTDGRPYPIHVTSSDSAYGWLKKEQLTGYDTGGYTGVWGKEGKLAMLHEKEIVLNAQDTERLLKAVEIIREMGKMIDINASIASLGIQTLALNSIKPTEQSLQQEVNIHAEFPNVVDHNEIEMAFNTLVNSATQYINNKY